MRSKLTVERRQQWRRTAVEIALFLILSLFLSLVYNAVSPTGLRILPKKSSEEKQAVVSSTLLSQSPMVLP
ncbi:MAG: hypothetical protein Q8K68_00965 [Nitrospirota bacterium]|nr:hypothetical protein [Nitrospirota bacterium]